MSYCSLFLPLMIIVEWSTGLFYTFNKRNACLGENAKDTQMCNFELKLLSFHLLAITMIRSASEYFRKIEELT